MRTAIEFFSYTCFLMAMLLALSPYGLLLWATFKKDQGIRRAVKINRKGKVSGS